MTAVVGLAVLLGCFGGVLYLWRQASAAEKEALAKAAALEKARADAEKYGNEDGAKEFALLYVEPFVKARGGGGRNSAGPATTARLDRDAGRWIVTGTAKMDGRVGEWKVIASYNPAERIWHFAGLGWGERWFQ
jgi:hypothetical protein